MHETSEAFLDTIGEDPWRAIAQVARHLTLCEHQEARVSFLQTFCKGIWKVPEVQYFALGRNLADMVARPGKGTAVFLEYVARLGHPIIVSGAEVEGLAHSANVPALLADGQWKTFLLAPLTTPGRVVGVLVLADSEQHVFTDEDLERLKALVAQVASVVDSTVLAQENRYKDAYSRALGDIDMMIASYDVVEILRHGVRIISETVEAEKVLVFIVNQDTGAVRVSVAEGCPYGREANLVHEPCARLAMQALKERKSQVVLHGQMENLPDVRRREACTEKQAIVTPIMANNQVYGVLEVFDKKNGKPFHRNEVAFINQVALKLALVIQNTHAYMTINRLNEGLEHKVRDRTSQLEQAITSLQETQSQLMQSEKLATIGTLAGGVAHEINNPLAAILANVQLLRLDVRDEESMDSLQLIESGAKRCKHIVENLLNYSRQSAPEHRSLSVNVVMQDTLDLLQHQIRHANVTLELVFGDLPPVIAVATELGQVFTNLIVNAIDALGDRHSAPIKGELAIRTLIEGRNVVIEVQDDGNGIEDHVIRKIFDPFFTTKEVGKGTGLGLSISQQIVTSFGGRIEATSIRGEGCTFRVVLPVAHGQGTGELPPLAKFEPLRGPEVPNL
jgi:signal transduction histidine kinase